MTYTKYADLTPEQKQARKEANARYAAKFPELVEARNLARRERNREKARLAAKRWREENPEKYEIQKLLKSIAYNNDPEKALARSRRKRYQSPEEVQEYNRQYQAKAKEEVFAHYGKECSCCGETRWEFLVIDHIDGGGVKHRKEAGVGYGSSFYIWLRKKGFPEGFRTLCDNCNASRGRYGYCPHEKERESLVANVVSGAIQI